MTATFNPELLDQFRLLVEGATDYAIVMLDRDGRITGWNPGAERIKGYAAEEIVGEHFSRFYPPEEVPDHPDRVLRVAAQDGRYEEEGWRVRKDGSRFWASVVVTALHDERGELRGFGKLVRDASERREAELERDRLISRLEDVARIDYLTGLMNRRGWNEELRRELAFARRHGKPLSIAVLDVDQFKTFNDEQGHLAGDHVLREIAAAWIPTVREIDVLARFGGDEFVCLLPDCTEEEAGVIVDRIRAATPPGRTASAGVARWQPPEPGEDLFRRADRALYRAKKEGGDRTVVAGRD